MPEASRIVTSNLEYSKNRDKFFKSNELGIKLLLK